MHGMDASNPWKTTGSQLKYNNPWIAVTEHQVIQPNDEPGIYGVVHFKNKAIAVLPIDEQGKTWLVGQFRYPLNQYSWEIPEGGGPDGEEPLETAKRELLEETGLTAANWELMGTAHLSNSVSDEVGLYFLATGLTQGTSCPDPTEELAIKHVAFSEALNMVLAGEITDSLSVMAILHYALISSRS
jgi:8-oxo-dGTP pyrophosphatase MutT (NUDIX family)